MKYWFIALACLNLGLIFGFALKGITGALLLGLTVLIVDYAGLRLRFGSLRKTGTSLKSYAVIGGFFFRIANLVLFLGVGSQWLIPAAQPFFQGMILTIPVWNLLAAATGWREGSRE
ncbi:MAG: hypothetical protein ACM3YE_16820 [Bacteroidota bacterium]